MEPFRLQDDPPRAAKPEYEEPCERQGVLFAGPDCLAGQMDLFATDGQDDREQE